MIFHDLNDKDFERLALQMNINHRSFKGPEYISWVNKMKNRKALISKDGAKSAKIIGTKHFTTFFIFILATFQINNDVYELIFPL